MENENTTQNAQNAETSASATLAREDVKKAFYTGAELNAENGSAMAAISAAITAFGGEYDTNIDGEAGIEPGFDVLVLPVRETVETDDGGSQRIPTGLQVWQVPSVEAALQYENARATLQEALLASHVKRIRRSLSSKNAEVAPVTLHDFLAPQVRQSDALVSFKKLARATVRYFKDAGVTAMNVGNLQKCLSNQNEAAQLVPSLTPEKWDALLDRLIAACQSWQEKTENPETGETVALLAPLDPHIFQHWKDTRNRAPEAEPVEVDLDGLQFD